MNTVETRARTTSTHPAVDAMFAAAARLAREATSRRTAPQACRAVVDALSTPALGFGGIALVLDRNGEHPLYQVVSGTWPPEPDVEPSLILTVPLLLDDARIGELTVFKSEGVFEESEAALITSAAAHAALGVARARLIEELEQLRASSTPRAKKRPSSGKGPRKKSQAGASSRARGTAPDRKRGG
jgi:GAF domain-containing protein